MIYNKRKKAISKCRELRQRGDTLNQILKNVNLPKTTVYGYIKDITLTTQQKADIKRRRKLLYKDKVNPRKGKCIAGREIRKPSSWIPELVHIVAHFMFDGHIGKKGCIYYNRSSYQIEHLRDMVYRVFGIQPKYHVREDGVRVIAFYNVEFADYIRSKAQEIFSYLKNGAARQNKKIFLQAFFDDEGNVYYNSDKKRVRGYQKSRRILQDIKNTLHGFKIRCKIYSNINAIEITGRKNLINFAKEINFSPLISLNPNRKNSIWKREIQKRDILDLAISSYKN